MDELIWLRELTRVVKPNGYIYMTLNTEKIWMSSPHDFLRNSVDSPHFPVSENPNIANIKKHYAAAVGGPMPAERFAVRIDNELWNTFHSSEYIRRVWNRFATVERIVDDTPNLVTAFMQAAVIMKNDKKSC
jgi:hypothetical protein